MKTLDMSKRQAPLTQREIKLCMVRDYLMERPHTLAELRERLHAQAQGPFYVRALVLALATYGLQAQEGYRRGEATYALLMPVKSTIDSINTDA